MSNTASAVLRPQLDGWHMGDNFKQGTGGHGDTLSAYTETFHRQLSLLKEQNMTFDTGKNNEKGEPIYYGANFKPARCSSIEEIRSYSPLIQNAFIGIGLSLNKSVACYNLMKWIENKEGKMTEVKKGLSFVVGDYEARLIKGKHVFLYKDKIVRSFKGKG